MSSIFGKILGYLPEYFLKKGDFLNSPMAYVYSGHICYEDEVVKTYFNKRNFIGSRQDLLVYNDCIIQLNAELIENNKLYSDWVEANTSSFRLWMLKFPYSLEKPFESDTIYIEKYTQTDTFKLKFLMYPCVEQKHELYELIKKIGRQVFKD